MIMIDEILDKEVFNKLADLLTTARLLDYKYEQSYETSGGESEEGEEYDYFVVYFDGEKHFELIFEFYNEVTEVKLLESIGNKFVEVDSIYKPSNIEIIKFLNLFFSRL